MAGCVEWICVIKPIFYYAKRLSCVFFFTPEPNLLSGTAHSVNKRGVKKRDLDVEELKEILSPLLPFVRTEHILPPNSDVLADAVGTFLSVAAAASQAHGADRAMWRSSSLLQLKRGLLSTPPSDMLPTAEGGKANAWLRQKNAGIYVRPRLFSPYVEEAKVRCPSNSEAPVSHFVFEVAILKESAGPTEKESTVG